ncbi:MAG: MFS transporter, partial [Eubacterium sp.]|nr:MFS transporter [Eubacterium sp.]
FRLLLKNKYYLMICAAYILQQLYSAMIGSGLFYMTWVLKNKNLFGQFAWAVNIPLIIALIFTPALVGRWKGMYKLNLRGYIIAVIGRALVVAAGYMGNVPLMLAFTALAALGQGPWQGDMNAVIASCSEYTYLTQGKRVDGTMYSCTSLGIKVGGGIGTAVAGWLLELSGYVGTNATQPQSALDMMQFMYLWLPFIFTVLIMLVLSRMNVEGANEKIKNSRCVTQQH